MTNQLDIDNEGQEEHTLDMLRIRDLIRAQGIPCIVEQTGGGCATLYAGTPSGQWEDEPDYYPVSAGPGTFYPTPEADDREFSVGSTDEAHWDERTDCEGMSVESIAAAIVRYVKDAA